MGAIEIATKGILGGVPGTKGFIVISIEEVPLRKGGTFPFTAIPKDDDKCLKKIRIKYIYNDIEYVDEKVVSCDLNVNVDNIRLDVIDNKPTIKIII